MGQEGTKGGKIEGRMGQEGTKGGKQSSEKFVLIPLQY